jgi:hypothetical protein
MIAVRMEVGIELFRPRQCLGLLDAREEAVPGDYRGDRVKGVLLVVAGRDQSGADAGVKADLGWNLYGTRFSLMTLNKVIALLEEAMAKNTITEKGSDEAEIRKVALEQAQRALRGVIAYLNSFEPIRAGGLVRVFAPLHSAMHNIGSGAHPPFVFEQEPPANSSDRPVDLMHDYVRAHLAFALELLLDPIGCMSKKTALAWLANEAAARRVVTEDGQPISTRQLHQWRRDIRAGASAKVSRTRFAELKDLYRDNIRRISQLPSFARTVDAQERARFIVQNIATLAPRDAPRRKAP